MKFAVILVVITVQTQVCFSLLRNGQGLGLGQGNFKPFGWKSNNTDAPAKQAQLLLSEINTTFSLLNKMAPSDTRHNLNKFAYETQKKSSQKHHNGHATDDPLSNKDNDNFPIGMLLLTIVVVAAVFGRIGWLICLRLKRCCSTAGESSLTRLIIDNNVIYVEGSGSGFATRSEEEEASVVHLGDNCELIILPSRNLVCLITRDGNGNRPVITPLRVSPTELETIAAATDEDEILNILQPQISRAFNHPLSRAAELFIPSTFERSPPPSYKNACRVRLESPPPPYESAVEIMDMMEEISENEDETDSITVCTSEYENPREQQGQDENNTEHRETTM